MNQPTHGDWKLLIRYVAGECTEREAAAVRAKIAVDDEMARLLHEIRGVWQATAPPAGGPDLDAVWSALRRRAADPPGVALHSSVDLGPRRRPGGLDRRTRRHRLRTPAVLAGVFAVVVLLFQFVDHPAPAPTPPVPEEHVFVTGRGERATIRLNDGSRVRLNVDSRLTVPLRFAGDRRVVQLEGEAYFDVVRDTVRPFLVEAGGAVVEVLGTSFDVAAYAGDAQVDVVVERGRVALAARGRARRDTVVIDAAQWGRFSGAGLQVVHDGVDLDDHVGWMRGDLVFHHASFDEVARRLERWFDIEVDVAGASRVATTLDVTFQGEPLPEVLKVIAATLGLEYTWSQRRVIFRVPAAPPVGASTM